MKELIKPHKQSEGASIEYKLEVYTDAYYLVWEELKNLKQALGLDPIKLVTDDQFDKIKSNKLFE